MSVTHEVDKLVGRTFGAFVLRERIGEGGFGAVYRAEQPALEREAVVKVLHNRLKGADVLTERFLREAKLASKLDHPYAAHIYAFGAEPDGELWTAMELVRGTPLDQVLRIQGPLPLERFVPLFDRICEVVQTAHEQGIVHRDIKPPNIMVLSRAGRLLPKLLDFGIAKLAQPSDVASRPLPKPRALTERTMSLSDTIETQPPLDEPIDAVELTREGAIVGSPLYMAPEQWANAGTVGARSDLYALCVVAYEVLTGKPPFGGNTLTAIASAHAAQDPPPLGVGFPAALDAVIAKALAKDPADRYPDALTLAAAFRKAAGVGSADTISLPTLDPARREASVTGAPRPIAEAVSSLEAARNPHQARDALFQLVHTTVHYLGLIALACRSRVSGPDEPASVAEALLTLHRRSLTDLEWLALIRGLTFAWVERRDAYPLPELVDALHGPLQQAFPHTLELEPRKTLAEQLDVLLSLREAGDTAQASDALLALLERGAQAMSDVLGELAFLHQYPLVVMLEDGLAEGWMGVRRPQRATIAVHGRAPPPGEPTLLNPDGVPILTLSPLFQVAAPTPNAPLEMFLFDGRDRIGAKLVALPLGFEHHDDHLWDWFRAQLSGTFDEREAMAAEERSPYRGLVPFSAEDGAMYVGREKLVDMFVNRLRVQPMLTVVGRSGSGKSSFVHAGVIPSLPPGYRVLTMRPGPAPIAVLEARLQYAGIAAKGLAGALSRDHDALGELLRADAAACGPLLLVIDQLEELFTLCQDSDERRLFAEGLALAARTAEDPIRVVFTLRDDFLVRAEQVPALRNRLGQSLQLLTLPLPDDLLRILVEPAKRVGYEFDDPSLPSEMVRDVADQPGALALLSFTAAKLWELRDRHFKQLTRTSYKSLGGVGGALARHAENTLSEMLPEEQALTREAFRHLVTTESTRAVLGRRELEQVLGDSKHADAVIEKLVAARLLVASENEAGAETIEIVHEALLAAWPRLVEWHREDAEGARLREQLRTAAKQWDERQRPKGLLWRGEALADYTRWRDRHPGPLTDLETAFADASVGDAARGRRLRRSLVGIAFAVLAVGVLVLSSLNATKEEQRRKAAEAQTRAESSERFALEEHGRQLFLDGDLIRATVYLNAAKEAGATSAGLDYLLDRSLSVLQKRKFVLDGHRGVVSTGKYSRDGRRLFTVGENGIARVWDTATGRSITSYDGHQGTIAALDLSSDESLLATAGEDGIARVWDARSGRLLHELKGPKSWCVGVRFSEDGRSLAAGALDGTIHVWNVAKATSIAVLQDRAGAVFDVAFTKDGTKLYAASHSALVRWDLATGKREHVLDEHEDAARRLALTADGRFLASAAEHTVKVWNTATDEVVRSLEIQSAFTGSIDSIPRAPAFSPDSRSVAAFVGKEAYVWEISTGDLRLVLRGHTADVTSIVFSVDGSRLATSSNDGTVRIWDASTGQAIALIPCPQAIRWTIFSRDDRELVIGGHGGMVEIWSARNDMFVRRFQSLGQKVWSVVLGPDHSRLAACGENGAIRVWSIGRELPELSFERGVTCVVAYNGNDRIAAGGDDSLIRFWDANTGKPLDELGIRGPDQRINTIAGSRDQVVVGRSDGRAVVWDVANSRIARTLEDHSAAIYSVAIASDGSVGTCDREGIARIWAPTGTAPKRKQRTEGLCSAIAFSLDGRMFATASNMRVQIWSIDASNGEAVTLDGHHNTVNRVAFTKTGLVVTMSDDATLRVWDTTGRLLDIVSMPAPIADGDIGGDMMVLASGDTIYLRQSPLPVADAVRSTLVAHLPFALKNGLLVPHRAQ